MAFNETDGWLSARTAPSPLSPCTRGPAAVLGVHDLADGLGKHSPGKPEGWMDGLNAPGPPALHTLVAKHSVLQESGGKKDFVSQGLLGEATSCTFKFQLGCFTPALKVINVQRPEETPAREEEEVLTVVLESIRFMVESLLWFSSPPSLCC